VSLAIVGFGLLLAAAPSGVKAPASPLAAIEARIESGQLALAETQLRQLLRQGSGGARAHTLLGLVLARQGRLPEAETELKAALAIAPSAADARQNLARVYILQKREAEAAVELRRAAQQRALERDLALALARLELAAGHKTAARTLLQALAARGDSVEAQLLLARIQAADGDSKGALGSLDRALAQAPHSEEVLAAHAQLLLGARAYVKAAQVLEPLTRMCPNVATHQYLMGVALLQSGDASRAIDFLQRASALEPGHALTLVALGLSLNELKRYAEARPLLTRALELEPDTYETLAVLAESEEGLDDLKAAEEHVDRVLARSATHPTANIVKGMILMKQQRYEEARVALEKAVAVEPTSQKAHYQLSLAYARLGDDVRSQREVALYKKAMKDTEERVLALRREAGLATPEGPTP
jgi:protein O-GlcNAc transferase